MKKRVFILHGWGGTADSGWKGWLKNRLQAKGFEVFSPQMPNAENPKLDEWLAALKGLVEKPDRETYFVGHSLGVVLIHRYLEGLSEGKRIGGAVLVAGPTDNPDIPQIAGFFKTPFAWEKIRAGCGSFVAINSDNDHYVALENGNVLKEKLGAKLLVLHNRGHFSSSEGTKELPEALEALLSLAGTDRR